MKEIEFGAEELSNLSEIGRKLFEDENDPRSMAYVRTLNRPKINWLAVFLHIACPVIALCAIGYAMNYYEVGTITMVLCLLGIFIVYVFLMMKRGIICLIHIYQRYASDATRNKCRFEPSCSEYTISVLQKYGLWKGLKKGIHRLRRCKVGDGGYDYP